MNKNIAAQLEQQSEDVQEAEVAAIVDKPLTIDAILELDRRKYDKVEINIANQQATLVETSNAPELTAEVLAEKGTLTVSDTISIVGEPLDVEILNGVPYALEMEQAKINAEYADRELTEKEEYQRDLNILRLLVSRLYVVPKFSFDGKGHGFAIAEQSDELLESLYIAISHLTAPYSLIGTYQDLSDSLEALKKKLKSDKSKLTRKRKSAENTKGKRFETLQSESRELERQIETTQAGIALTETSLTHIYQIPVLRGSPLHSALITDNFEIYPTQDGKPIKDMNDDEIQMRIKRFNAQRNAFVASMILSPRLSWNGEGETGAYPVEKIGDNMMQALYNAHRAVNLKPGGLDLLQRFRKVGQNRVWKGAVD